MRATGLLLVTLGFLGGALTAVLRPEEIDLRWFLPALGVGVLGVALVQIARRREAKDESKLESSFEALDKALANIVEKATELESTKTELDIYALPQHIDDVFIDDINRFVEARESISHVWGMQAYANIMTHFAAGERYLNRVWTTAADGYIDEAHTYVDRSREQFRLALDHLEKLHEGQPHGLGGAERASSPADG